MNAMLIRSLMPPLLIQSTAGQHRVYRRHRHRDRAHCAAQTLLTDGEAVAGSRRGTTSNSDLGLRVRLVTLKSP